MSLLINGALVDVPGLRIVPPASHGGPSFNRLGTDDYTARKRDVSILVLHSTGGHWPQPVRPGAGKPGHAREILDMWSGADRGGGERENSGAELVVDFDGTIYCAGDLLRMSAYEAQLINQRAAGVEMCTYRDGSITEATLEATLGLAAALTHSGEPVSGLLNIPFQMPRGPYRNAPLRRLEVGGVQNDGAGFVGVIGHRDQTRRRGPGDPGDAIWKLLAARGAEGLDYDGQEDLLLGRQRQTYLNQLDAKRGNTFKPLVVDGVFGSASAAAMKRWGYRRWRDVGCAERAA